MVGVLVSLLVLGSCIAATMRDPVESREWTYTAFFGLFIGGLMGFTVSMVSAFIIYEAHTEEVNEVVVSELNVLNEPNGYLSLCDDEYLYMAEISDGVSTIRGIDTEDATISFVEDPADAAVRETIETGTTTNPAWVNLVTFFPTTPGFDDVNSKLINVELQLPQGMNEAQVDNQTCDLYALSND